MRMRDSDERVAAVQPSVADGQTPSAPKRPRRHRALRVSVLALLVLAGPAYYEFRVRLPVGSGPAGPAVPRSAFAKPWTTRPVLLLGLGDSVTAGYGARKGYSYFDRLVANPSDEYDDIRGLCLSAVLPNLTARNGALSGSTSLDQAGLLAHAFAPPAGAVTGAAATTVASADTQPADTLGLVVMTVGGNDLIHSYGRSPPREGAMYGATLAQAQPWIAAFEPRLGGLLDDIAARFPGGCHIFLANIYDPTDGGGDAPLGLLPAWPDGEAILQQYNAVVARCAAARPNVHLVNIHDAFLGHGFHCRQFWRGHYHFADPHYWYYGNVEDPNERGYDALRRLFLIEIAKVLGAKAE